MGTLLQNINTLDSVNGTLMYFAPHYALHKHQQGAFFPLTTIIVIISGKAAWLSGKKKKKKPNEKRTKGGKHIKNERKNLEIRCVPYKPLYTLRFVRAAAFLFTIM